MWPPLPKNKLLTGFSQISDLLADILFPVSCLGCGQEGTFICKKCLAALPRNSFQVCPACEKTIMPNGDVCSYCKRHRPLPLKRLFVASDYQDPLLAKAIHCFKYQLVSELALPLGKLMTQALLRFGGFPTPELIIPVPLHRRRLRWRGFNQAQLLSEVLARDLLTGLELSVTSKALVRKQFTKPQMELKDYQTRQQNIQNCFQVDPAFSKQIKGKKNSFGR